MSSFSWELFHKRKTKGGILMLEKMARKSRHGGRVQRWNRHQIEKKNRKRLRKTMKKIAMDYEKKAEDMT